MAVSIYLVVWQAINCWSLAWHFVLVTFIVIVSLLVTNTVLCFRVLAADGYLGKRRTRRQRASMQQQQMSSATPVDYSLKTGGGGDGTLVSIEE